MGRRIKIVSKGTGFDTEVIDVETGEPLADVYSVRWDCDAMDVASATITITGVPIEVEGLWEVPTKDVEFEGRSPNG